MLLQQFSLLISEEKEGNKQVSILQINANHEVFEGHFPEQPVTPGVMLIQLFKEAAERFYQKKLLITETHQVKFLSVINPKQNNEIKLQSVFLEKDNHLQLTGKAIQNNMVVLKLKLIFNTL